ncbi:hypothetical protein [Actinoallomurus sp. CA-150999]|uniref:hypothetical protein n=1 Tax=Actinoallomurus sp. CA-150999 TaxID=3239887 RepID=UPI003D94FEEC
MRGTVGRRLVAVSGLALSTALCASPGLEARAAVLPRQAPITALTGDNNHNGNGSHNTNSITIRSPAFLKGIQHVSDGNVRALTNTNHAFCKKRRYCRIHQRAINIVR